MDFTPRRKVILAIFGLTFAVMTYGVIPFHEMGLPLPELGWWFPELSALFLVGGVVIGLIFVAGCADLLGVALIIGISRGITVLMNDGGITDTILHWGEQALSGTGSISFVLLVYLIYLPLTVLIPSSSGLATLSVPVIPWSQAFSPAGWNSMIMHMPSAWLLPQAAPVPFLNYWLPKTKLWRSMINCRYKKRRHIASFF